MGRDFFDNNQTVSLGEWILAYLVMMIPILNLVKSKFVCKFKTCTMHGVPKQRLVVSTDQRQCV